MWFEEEREIELLVSFSLATSADKGGGRRLQVDDSLFKPAAIVDTVLLNRIEQRRMTSSDLDNMSRRQGSGSEGRVTGAYCFQGKQSDRYAFREAPC